MKIMKKNNKLVLGLIGEKGGGKGTVAKYLIEKYGADHFVTSDFLKEIMNCLYIPETRENLIKLAMVLKNGLRQSILMDALIKKVAKSKSKIVIADGIRMDGDIEPFQKKFGKNFKLVYVTAPVKVRFERTKKRKEKVGEDKTTFKQFLKEEKAPTEAVIHKIGETADVSINNGGSVENTCKQIDKFIKKY